jgi:uncharacterized repeat protein (TIGR03943 family)
VARGKRLQLFQTVVLLALALYFGYNLISGNITNYINTRFAWLSYAAAILFALLGLISLYFLLRDARDDAPRAFGQGQQRITLPVAMVMLIPLAFGVLLPSRPLGAEAITGGVTINAAAGASAALITKDPLERNVLDWARTFTGSSLPATFDGERADVIGFVYTEPSFPDNHFMVARFTVSCCVADASPIGLPVLYDGVDAPPEGEWVRIQGMFRAGDFRGQTTPVLLADSVEVVAQPEHPYLYP